MVRPRAVGPGPGMPVTVDTKTLVDLFETAVMEQPQKTILRCRVAGIWHPTTLLQWRTMAANWARGLVAHGIELGDRVGILSNTRREWLIADMAIQMAGAVTVPVYPSILADEVSWILHDSGTTVLFVEDPCQLEKVLEIKNDLPHLRLIVCLDEQADASRPDQPGVRTVRLAEIRPNHPGLLATMAQLADAGRSVHADELAGRRLALQAADTSTIVYTSGTTGRPKGVILSHGALVFEVKSCTSALDVRPDDAVMLFLPLAHSFAKLIYLVCVGVRTEMIFPQSIQTLLADMADAQPTVLPSVPRIFEKAHMRILGGVDAAGPVRKRLFEAALATGYRVSQLRQAGKEPSGLLAAQHQVAHRFVFAKIHAIFGGRVRAFISGGAPLAKELAEFFHAVGLPVLEGYGMTENCAAATVNRPDRYRLGSVGQPLPGIDVRIAADGEILIRGANLFSGYQNNEAATAESLKDGWLYTGDVGALDADGFLYITDRKKDLLVTAGGKNIAPQNIERLLRSDPLIANALVYGDRRKFLSALLTLDEEVLQKWADSQAISYASLAELTQHAEVFKRVQAIVDAKNRGLASYETIKKFAILERDLSEQDGDLTPSLKVRRQSVISKHKGLLDSFYSEHY